MIYEIIVYKFCATTSDHIFNLQDTVESIVLINVLVK